jgi:hypothetical protein
VAVLAACVVVLTPEVYMRLLSRQPLQHAAACVDSDGKLDAIQRLVANATHHARAEVQRSNRGLERLVRHSSPAHLVVLIPPSSLRHRSTFHLGAGTDAGREGVAAAGGGAH